MPQICCLVANFNSLILDYVARQKIGGLHLKKYLLYQLPVLPPTAYTRADIDYIAPRVLELVYTAWDLQPFAQDMGYAGEPFRWDEERRAHLRAELDAYYARLYGLTRDELCYILDPKEVYGEDFPGETFRVLKDKELKQYGEYRTRRLVLEKWDELEAQIGAREHIEERVQEEVRIPPEHGETKTLTHFVWIPSKPVTPPVGNKQTTPKHRQVIGVAWLLENFGQNQSISMYKAQKFSYFMQQAKLADMDIEPREFARGPYDPAVKYKAGAYAEKKRYWKVRGGNIVRERNMNEAVTAAKKILTDETAARALIQRLAELTPEQLGGLATVDFACRAIHEQGQPITTENIRGYFQTNWKEKHGNLWFTDENIIWALDLLSELGLLEKTRA